MENRYGIKEGDIFVQSYPGPYQEIYNYFYQVTELRGAAQVVVKEIRGAAIAFDKDKEQVVPVPSSWVREEESIVRNVEPGQGNTPKKYRITADGWEDAVLYQKGDRYLGVSCTESIFLRFEDSQRELAKQLDLNRGSGIFAIGEPFAPYDKDRTAEIRYPDGKRQKVLLRDLFLQGKRVLDEKGRTAFYTVNYQNVRENDLVEVVFTMNAQEQEIGDILEISCRLKSRGEGICVVIHSGKPGEERNISGDGEHTERIEIQKGKTEIWVEGGREIEGNFLHLEIRQILCN